MAVMPVVVVLTGIMMMQMELVVMRVVVRMVEVVVTFVIFLLGCWHG